MSSVPERVSQPSLPVPEGIKTVGRVTADDPHKDPIAMRAVATGLRLPVELGAEAFTLAMLDAAHLRFRDDGSRHVREHLTHALFDVPPPAPPPGRTWSIDTREDYEAVLRELSR